MITLAEAKLHCRVDDEYFDNQVQTAIDAALDYLRAIDVEISDRLPPAVHRAGLMLTAHFFEEATGGMVDGDTRMSPFGVQRLVAPYRKISL